MDYYENDDEDPNEDFVAENWLEEATSIALFKGVVDTQQRVLEV